MDIVDLFNEVCPPTGHNGMMDHEMDIAPEQEFINFLDADDNLENFGLSILENNHDLIDVMTPLFASPFSPVPCDNLDLIDSGFQQMHHQLSSSETSESTELSPLKQLLLGGSRNATTNTTPDADDSPPPTRKTSTRRQSARSSRSEKSRTSKRASSNGLSNDNNNNKQSNEQANVKKDKTKAKEKAASKALKFPPCYICGGLASGLHYGVNSCEACKGFFRRYIIRNEEYKCSKGGNCTVVNKNRENCSGCRLQKCLKLGMSKENCKLGRYSLSRRTETIKKVNVLEGKEKLANKPDTAPDSHKFDHTYSGPESGNYLSSLHDIVPADCCPSSVIEELVRAMEKIQPYGPNITSKKQIQKLIKHHHIKYQNVKQTNGHIMKVISNDEYYKLFKEFGIDVDGRLKVFKEYIVKLERLTERYCNFARQIPGFSKLNQRDQSKLLNAFRCDVFIILMHECYNKDLGILLARNGVAYHIEELADRCFSRTLINGVCEAYYRFQCLGLSKEEKCLLMALSLTFTDRCKLSDPTYVDKMQYIVSEVLRYYLERAFGSKAQHRLAKFIEILTYLREVSERYITELTKLCKDETVVREIPLIKSLVSDDCE